MSNLIKGLEASVMLPTELVIVHINEPVVEFNSDLFSIRSFRLDSAHKLPLAEARNKAVACAGCSDLIFIDVDCIPASDLVKHYAAGFKTMDQIWTGPVRYLRKEASASPDFLNHLPELSDPDPVRGDLQNMSYELFWSLNFGCSKSVFNRVGGFDTDYQGYGAEDTDFSFSARKQNVPIGTLPAVAYHQHHPACDPPLNHLHDIVTNARVFFKKWDTWPMEGWLKKFVSLGYITWADDQIGISRYPEQHEIQAAIKP